MPEEICDILIADIPATQRFRKEFRHIEQLANSLRSLGMLHPVVVNSRKEVIAGSRRIEAAKRCGWTTVPCRIVSDLDDATKALLAERDENTCRDPLNPSEMVELGRMIEAMEKPKAEARQQETLKQNASENRGGNLPPRGGKTRDKVGDALGVSGSTYERAKKVVEAAETDPEKFGDLPAKMDTGSVHAAHEELKRRLDSEPDPDFIPEDPDYVYPGDALPQPAFDAGRRPLPWHLKRPGGGNKNGEHTGGFDPDHPYAEILKKFTALVKELNKVVSDPTDKRLLVALTKVSLITRKTHMVWHGNQVTGTVEDKVRRTRFIGLGPLRAVVRKAGRVAKALSDDQVAAAFDEANDPDRFGTTHGTDE